MKKAFLLFILAMSSVFCYAQDDDDAPVVIKSKPDTSTHKTTKISVAVWGSAGVNIQRFKGSTFIDTLANKMVKYPAQADVGFFTFRNISTTTYSNYSVAPYLAAGIDLRSGEEKNLDNIFGVTYTRFSGQYSYNAFVGGDDDINAQEEYDTAKGSYTCNVFALQYAFQVTTRYFYVSAGVKLDFNFVKATQQVNVNDSSFLMDFPSYRAGGRSIVNQSQNEFYLSVPFQISAGGIIRVKKIEFRIGGYYNLYGGQSYNSMGIILTVLHIPKGF